MTPARCLAALLAALGASACSTTPPASPASVIGWALGPQQLTPEPAARDRYLLLLPARRPIEDAKPVHHGCLPATELLPAPAPDPRIFLLARGQVYARRAPGEEPALLDGNDPALGVTRLLAFERHASPLRMLIAARPAGAAGEQLWTLTLEDHAIGAAEPVGSRRAPGDMDAFFAGYDVPRCLDGGKRCLVPSSDRRGWYLDVQPVRGATPVELQAVREGPVLDAAWAAPDGSAIYLLVPCPA